MATLTRPAPTDLAPPHPVAPLSGAVVDAGSPTFIWEPVPGATAYQVQIAPDRQFARDVIAVDAGPSAQLVLFDTLPNTGTALFWRVRAETPNGTTRWSPYGRFIAGSDDQAEAYRLRREAERAEARKARLHEEAEAAKALDLVPFWQREADVSTDREAQWIGLAMILSFVLTLLLIVAASLAA